MPSLPDLDTDLDLGPVDGPLAPSDVLASVKSEGLRRRNRRHRRNAVLAAFGLVLAAVPAVSLLAARDRDPEAVTVASGGDEEGAAVDAPRTTVDRPATTVVSPDSTLPPPAAEDPAVVVEEEPVGESPATTVPVSVTVLTCQNSTDPACGEFRWAPAPAANQPLTASFVDAPTTAVVGQPVTFAVEWADPDASLVFDYFSADGVGLAPSCTEEARHGPWAPPAPAADSGVVSYPHTFSAPGTYQVIVSLGSAADPAGACTDPYASSTTVEVTVTVS